MMRRLAFAVLAIAVIFVLAISWTYVAIARVGAFQHDVRAAQLARSQLLVLQIDEETGVRGFVLSRDPRYLDPYRNAVKLHDSRFEQLSHSLERIGASPDVREAVTRERMLHTQWLSRIARPLIAKPARPTAPLLLSQGKDLIDAYRRQNLLLFRALADASDEADSRLRLTLLQIVGLATLLALGVIFVLVLFSWRQLRLEGDVVEQRRLYEAEKRIADTLQEAFTQRSFPVSPGLGFHAIYIPATEEARIGGDWYDAFALPDGRVLFSIGDVAGHGLQAAVSMSRVRQAIIATALYERDPARVLARANGSLMLQETGMVTALCGYVDPVTFEIVYASAGHPAPILARPGEEPLVLETGGVPLGVVDDASYATSRARAAHGALLVLYTDGATEYGRNVIEGERRLVEAVRVGLAGEINPAATLRQRIFDEVQHTDDVAIMTISFHNGTVSASGSSSQAVLSAAPGLENSGPRFARMIRGAKPSAPPARATRAGRPRTK